MQEKCQEKEVPVICLLLFICIPYLGSLYLLGYHFFGTGIYLFGQTSDCIELLLINIPQFNIFFFYILKTAPNTSTDKYQLALSRIHQSTVGSIRSISLDSRGWHRNWATWSSWDLSSWASERWRFRVHLYRWGRHSFHKFHSSISRPTALYTQSFPN